ncbi:uncharacterized [Tachysurus ichikawai]
MNMRRNRGMGAWQSSDGSATCVILSSLQQLPAERVDETISDRDLQEQIELVMAEARHGMWEAAEQRSKGGG